MLGLVVLGRVEAFCRLPQHDVCAAFAAADLASVLGPCLVRRPPAAGPAAVRGDHGEHECVPSSVGPAVGAAGRAVGEAVPGHPPPAGSVLDGGDQVGGDLVEQFIGMHRVAPSCVGFPVRVASARSGLSTRRARPRGTRGLTAQRPPTHHRTRPQGGNVRRW